MAGFTGAPPIVTDGLVFVIDAANYESYPDSGTVFNNLADSSNNFTINGGPTFNTSPDRFTFSSNQITKYFEKSSYSFPANDYSVSIWVKFTTTSFTGATVSYAVNSSSTGNNESLMYFSSGDLRFYGPNGGNVSTSWTIPNTTSWFNLVRVRTKTNGNEKLYVNGVQEYSGTLDANISNGTPGTLIFGQEQDSVGGGFDSSQCFYGDFAAMKLYNRTLTPSEVTQNYNSIKSRFNL